MRKPGEQLGRFLARSVTRFLGRPLDVRADQAFLDCESREFCHRMGSQLRHQGGAVKLHGFDGNLENFSDLLILLAFGDELQDLPLPMG